MRNRIKELLAERAWTNDELAAKLGVHTTTISRLINSKRKLSDKWIDSLAAAFEIPPEQIIAAPIAAREVLVGGQVQAGLWSDDNEWLAADVYPVWIPDDPSLKQLTLKAAEVRGPSMDRRYPEGTVVVFTDHVETGERLIPGKRYVVTRERRDGQQEATVKMLWKDENGRLWLLPESSDPRFQEPLPLEPDAETDTVRIVGRVVWAVHKE